MTDRIKTVDLSDHATLMECYIGLNKTCADLRAENEKLRETQKLLIDALKETLAVACRNEDGYYAQAARKVLAAAIREGERYDG